MKKLLSILFVIQMASTPVLVIINNKINYKNFNFYYNRDWNEIPYKHYIKMQEIIEQQETDLKIIFNIFEQTYKMIYLIVEEENLESYMRTVNEFKNYIQIFELNNWYSNEYNRIRTKIDATYANWVAKEDFDSLVNQFINLSEDEKYMASKTYYAYNQSSSYYISKDIDYYQNVRIKNVEASANINSINNQIENLNILISEAERQIKLVENLEHIFDNWIKTVEILEKTIWEYSSPFNDFKKYEESTKERKILVINETIEMFFEPNEVQEVIKNIEKSLDNRTINLEKNIEAWIYEGLEEEGIETKISNEDLAKNVQKEIDKRIKEEENSKLKLPKNIKEKICIQVFKAAFQIDAALMRGLRDAMNEYYEFVNIQLPKISDEIRDIFKANNIEVSSQLNESFKLMNKILADIASQLIIMFSPDAISRSVAQIALGHVMGLENWWIEQKVTQQIGKITPLIEQAKQEAVRIPDEAHIDIEKEKENIKNLNIKLDKNIDIFNKTSEELKNSKYDYYSSNLEEWNKFMVNYFDFLNIEKNARIIILDPSQYFNNLYLDYELLSIQRFFVYNKMIRTANAKEFKIIKDFENDNNTLTEIFNFVYKHKEDFK